MSDCVVFLDRDQGGVRRIHNEVNVNMHRWYIIDSKCSYFRAKFLKHVRYLGQATGNPRVSSGPVEEGRNFTPK